MHGATGDVAEPCDRLSELGLAISLDAGNGNDFPGAYREGNVVDHRQTPVVRNGDLVQLQDGGARLGGRLVHHELDRAANHHRRQGRFVAFGRCSVPDDLAQAHHGDAVGYGEHLLELVGDEQDRAVRTRQATGSP